MTWSEIGKDSMQAAKQILNSSPRSCVSRAYYAAHVVLTESLLNAGCTLETGRQTPPHLAQAKLVGQYLAGMGDARVREIRAVIRRLYARRIDADYKRTITVDQVAARDSVRDVSTLFSLLGVK